MAAKRYIFQIKILIKYNKYSLFTYKKINSAAKFSTFKSKTINVSDYYEVCEKTLEIIQDRLEESDMNKSNVEVNLISGNLKFAVGTKNFVLNKQTPTRQLWLSSPVSGPHKYDFDVEKKRWVSKGDTLENLLSIQISDLCGKKIEFNERF